MDVNKYTIPNLPDMQHILEDLSDPDIIKTDQPINLSADEETLQNAYVCHISYKQLASDLDEQAEFSSRLDQLNKKLVDNIGSMKAQIKTNTN